MSGYNDYSYEAPESVKYHGGYDPADPPQGEHWCSECEQWDDECVHCDVCGKCIPRPTEDGICVDCTMKWLASRQIEDRKWPTISEQQEYWNKKELTQV